MEPRVLKYFLMVAREENITKTAQLLHVTQPTLSRQLMQLEEELGVQLFHRGKHNVTLTEDGMLLRRRAQELVSLSEKAKMELQHKEEMQIVLRVHELAERYGAKMQQIALAWHWAKGVASPIIGATKARYLDDAVGALAVTLTAEDIAYLEEPYLPHRVVGAIDQNPADGVILLDEKK